MPEAGPRPGINRSSVHDRDGDVVGYELLFTNGPDTAHPGPEVEPSEPSPERDEQDRRTSEVILTAFGDFGLARLGGRRDLHVNITRSMLTGALPMPLDPLRAVLEVLHPIRVDAELLDGVRGLKQQGFRFLIDGNVSGPAHASLLPLVDVIKVDIAGVSDRVGELTTYLRSVVPQARLLAEGITAAGEVDAARAVAFELYQGPYFRPRTERRGVSVSPSQAISLQLLAALSDPGSSVAELERIVAADPGLSLRVLAAVNSAAGSGAKVRSLRQAIVLMGRRSLSAWVMLAALGGHAGSRREDMIDVLTRARTCELLSPHLERTEPSTLYAVGLLSAVVQVMGADPHQVTRSARLDATLTEALVHRTGPVGELLDAVEEFDRTGRTPTTLPPAEMSRAQLHAFGSAVETVDAILGLTV